jgi:hypothetical protein
MGQLLVAAAGGLIGSLFGMPQLGFLAGSLLGSALFPQNSSSGKLTSLVVTSSTWGTPIPRVWGTVRIGGNIIWAQNIQQKKGGLFGGKGGAGQTSYKYTWSGAVGICVGPITSIVKIWADTKIVYDATGASGNTLNQYHLKFRLYKGTEDQVPDTIANELFGAANAQAHRGMAYIVFDDLPLANYGNRIPSWTFEVSVNGVQSLISGGYGFTYDVAHAVGAPTGTVALPDWDRNRVFLLHLGQEGATPTAGITAVHIDTGAAYFEQPVATVYGGASKWIYAVNGGGACLGKDGFIYLVSDPANRCQFAKIDPNSLTAVGFFGTASSSLVNSKDGLVEPGQICAIQIPASGANFIVNAPAASTDGVSAFCGDTMLFSGVSFPTDELVGSCCAGPANGNTATAYIIGKTSYGSPNANPVGVYVMTFAEGAEGFLPDTYPGQSNPLITFSKSGTFVPTDVDNTLGAPAIAFSQVWGPAFDPTDGNILIECQMHYSVGIDKVFLIKVDVTDAKIIWSTQLNGLTNFLSLVNGDPSMTAARIVNGSYAILVGGNGGSTDAFVFIFDTTDGTVEKDDWTNQLLLEGQQYWDEVTGGLILFGGDSSLPNFNIASPFQWGIIYPGRSKGQSVLLSQIVTDICGMVTLQPSDIDVTDLTDVVPGYVMPQQMTAKDAIAPLTLIYFFDGFESDFLLKFVHRGHASVATISATDLARIENKKNSLVQITRVQEVDLPIQVSLQFFDPNNDYQASTAYARRPLAPFPVMYSNNILSQDVPISLDPTDAKNACERTLYSAWINRVQYKIKLPWQYLIYDPTDVLVLYPDTQSVVTVRLASNDVGVDYSIDTIAISESGESYNLAIQPVDTYIGNAVAYGGSGFVPQQISIPGASKFIPMDTPLLQDIDDTGFNFTLLYYAGGGYVTSWPGLELYKSADQVAYVDVGGITHAAAWGTATTALGDPSDVFATDNTNTVTIAMSNGGPLLTSISYMAMVNGGNGAVLLKANGEVEVIQFQNVVQNSDGTYTLSTLLRGRRGTDTMAHTHLSGETFVLLTPSTGVNKVELSLEDLNLVRYYKPVTEGALLENATAVGFVATGRPLKPYAPVHVAAALSGSDIDLTWVRRTRINGAWNESIGVVPLAETTEAYDIDIYNGPSVVRTLSIDFGATPVAFPGITYTAAEITADFGSTPSTLSLAVYQKSSAVGRGFGYIVTVPVM